MENLTVVGITPGNNSRRQSFARKDKRGKKASEHPESTVSDDSQYTIDPISNIEEIRSKVSQLNSAENPHSTPLRFEVVESSSDININMMDSETGDLLRCIPADEFMHIANTLLVDGSGMSKRSGRWIDLDA